MSLAHSLTAGFGRQLGLAVIVLLLSASAALAKPEIRVEASPRELALGQSLQLNLTLVQEASEKGAMIEAPSLALPQLPGFEVLGQQTSSSMVSSGSRLRMMIQSQYRLRPLKAGEQTIPSLTFSYTENGSERELATQPVTIRVRGSAGVDLSALLLVGLGALILAAGFVLLRKRQASAPSVASEPEVAIPLPAGPTGLDALAARLERGESPDRLFEELYAWFRELALRRGWAPAQGATHQEILATLRYESGLPAARLDAIGDFLRACDQMRFANHDVAPDRLRELLELARRFC